MYRIMVSLKLAAPSMKLCTQNWMAGSAGDAFDSHESLRSSLYSSSSP